MLSALGLEYICFLQFVINHPALTQMVCYQIAADAANSLAPCYCFNKACLESLDQFCKHTNVHEMKLGVSERFLSSSVAIDKARLPKNPQHVERECRYPLCWVFIYFWDIVNSHCNNGGFPGDHCCASIVCEETTKNCHRLQYEMRATNGNE